MDEEFLDDDAATEADRTQRVRDQGKPDGLFRACMDAIEQQHTIGQQLRGLALGAGLMTDSRCYAELLAQFYLCTREMECRLRDEACGDLVRQVAALAYHFTPDYEADLRHLIGEDWRARVEFMANVPTQQYMKRIQNANEPELVAAAFILWGPLVIGGGAALKPRVRKAFGAEATHVFEQVTGVGREKRKKAFISVYDGLCSQGDEALRDEVAIIAGELMQGNNDLMLACQQTPWWSKYAYAGTGMLAAVAGYFVLRKRLQPTQ